MKRNKYHAEKCGRYASRKESRRAAELRYMLRAGLIEDLREQVRFELLPTQRDADGKLLERPCAYVADFVYKDKKNGVTVVEDVKGMKTPVYTLKRKMMLYFHGIRITEK